MKFYLRQVMTGNHQMLVFHKLCTTIKPFFFAAISSHSTSLFIELDLFMHFTDFEFGSYVFPPPSALFLACITFMMALQTTMENHTLSTPYIKQENVKAIVLTKYFPKNKFLSQSINKKLLHSSRIFGFSCIARTQHQITHFTQKNSTKRFTY